MLKWEYAGKRVWFVEYTDRASGWTLRGGFPKAMMRQDPSLRQYEIGTVFRYKKGLLRHMQDIGFGGDGDSVVIDGVHIIRW